MTAKADATSNPEAKISNSLKRVVKTFDMSDSFRSVHPKAEAYSRYYGDVRGHGASRLDRQYHWADSPSMRLNISLLPYLTTMD